MCATCLSRHEPDSDIVEHLLRALFDDLDLTLFHRISDFVGKKFPETSVRDLLGRILGEDPEETFRDGLIRDQIESKIVADYCDDRTVEIQGWIFAVTEMELWQVFRIVASESMH